MLEADSVLPEAQEEWEQVPMVDSPFSHSLVLVEWEELQQVAPGGRCFTRRAHTRLCTNTQDYRTPASPLLYQHDLPAFFRF